MNDERLDTAWQAPELAATYLEGVRDAVPLAEVHLDVMTRILRAGPPVQRFLDLGCGDGFLGAAIIRAFPQAHGVFGDFSEAMLHAAYENVGDREGRCRFNFVDYATPAWVKTVEPHGAFDAIVSGFSIHHQPDERKRALYHEILDLLTPGGAFINVEHVASRSPLGETLFADHFIDALYEGELRRGGTRSREEIGDKYHHRCDMEANLLTPVEVQVEWLRELGYVDADCFFKLFEIAVFGGRKPA